MLDDNPTSLDLKLLSQDILLYDGRGCRSIAILFVTRSFDLELLKEKLVEFRMQFEASQSCLESLILPSAFQEARASVSNSVFKKGRGFLLSEGPGIEQNAGHLRVVRYNHISEVNKWLDDNENKVQHLATSLKKFDCQLDSSNFGKSQKPRIDWDPDGDDLIAWLSI